MSADNDGDCTRCHATMFVPDGLEPTDICDVCAHIELESMKGELATERAQHRTTLETLRMLRPNSGQQRMLQVGALRDVGSLLQSKGYMTEAATVFYAAECLKQIDEELFAKKDAR